MFPPGVTQILLRFPPAPPWLVRLRLPTRLKILWGQLLPLFSFFELAVILIFSSSSDAGVFIADVVTDLVNGIRLCTGEHPIWGGLTVDILMIIDCFSYSLNHLNYWLPPVVE